MERIKVNIDLKLKSTIKFCRGILESKAVTFDISDKYSRELK